MKISVAIPTFNSSKYLIPNLNNLIKTNLISEIVIRDDCSNFKNKELADKILKSFQKKTKIDIRYFQNKKNLGAFENKLEVIKDCREEYVYQVDSDNIPMNNFNRYLNKFIKYPKDSTILYLPSKIFQFRTYHNICRSLSHLDKKYIVRYRKDDFIFDKVKIQNSIKKKKNYLIDKNIRWVLNSGNFIVNRDSFLSTISEGTKIDKNILTLDAVAISYLWLKDNKKIKIDKNLYHFHRKRSDSVSFTEKAHYENAIEYLENKILDL